jgi:cholesterol transport system auxiliary component
MRSRALILAGSCLALTGCGSLLESTMPAPQSYVLRLPQRTASAPVATVAGSLLVQRPEAGPGLASEYIALLRSGQRFDFYAASRWAAPAPDLVENVLVDQLRDTGMFSAVFDDSSPYAPVYNLRCEMRRFEADYTASNNSPTIQVALDCTFGRHRDRTMLASFAAQGSAAATDDRLGAVIAGFESATATALAEVERQIAAALGAERPASGSN